MQRRTTVMLPPVYETRFQTIVIGILFAPIGALVNIDVLLKPVLQSTLMPFEASVSNSAYVCARAVLLFAQMYLSKFCHRDNAFYFANPVVSLAVQNILLAAIYQWCVHEERVRAIFAGHYDSGSTSHCHVVIEQELAENLGGGLQVQRQATGARSAGVKSPSERTGASPVLTARRRLRNPLVKKSQSRASVLASSPSHFDLDAVQASGHQLQAELEEMIAQDRSGSPSLSPQRQPQITSPPLRRMQTIAGPGLRSHGSPQARPTFRHGNTVARLQDTRLDVQGTSFDRDMGPQPAIIHDMTDHRITADRGRDFGPMTVPTSPSRPSTRAYAARSLPHSPPRRPASPPARPTFSPPRRPASPPFRSDDFKSLDPPTSPSHKTKSPPKPPLPSRSSLSPARLSPFRASGSPPKSVSISPTVIYSPTRREERDRKQDSPFARQSRPSDDGPQYKVEETVSGFSLHGLPPPADDGRYGCGGHEGRGGYGAVNDGCAYSPPRKFEERVVNPYDPFQVPNDYGYCDGCAYSPPMEPKHANNGWRRQHTRGDTRADPKVDDCCVDPESCAARSFQASGEYFDVVSQCEGLKTYDRTILDEYCVHVSACDTPKSGRNIHFRWSILFLFLAWFGAYLPYVLPLVTYRFNSYEAAGRVRVGSMQHARIFDVASSLARFDLSPHGAWMTIPPAQMTVLFVLDVIDFFLIWVLSFEALQYVWAALAIFTNIRNVTQAFTKYFPHYIALKARKNVEVWMHERRDILAFRNRPWILLRPLVVFLFVRVLYTCSTVFLAGFRSKATGLPFWFGIMNFWSLRLLCFGAVAMIAFLVCWLVQRDVNLEFQSHWILQTSLASQAPLANEGRAYLLTAKQRFQTTDARLRLFPRQAQAKIVALVTVGASTLLFVLRLAFSSMWA